MKRGDERKDATKEDYARMLYVRSVQRMLGHKSAAMTLDTYADLFDDDLDAVATALDDARSRANVGKMWAIPVKTMSSRQADPRQIGDAR
jgi:hypothetical protein